MNGMMRELIGMAAALAKVDSPVLELKLNSRDDMDIRGMEEAGRRAGLAVKEERKNAGNGWRKGRQAWPK